MVRNKSFINKKIVILFLLIFFLSAGSCRAANLNNAFGEGSKLNDVAGDKGAGYKTEASVTPEGIAGAVITIILSLIGVIFLVLMIYGGFIWMMARGNEQEVEKAKQIIQNSIIGLVIVLAAYAISWYVINALGNAALRQSTTSNTSQKTN